MKKLLFDLKKYPSTFCFFAVLIFMYGLISCKALNSSLQLKFMEQFHLKNSSFIQWALFQPVPSMYNFTNEFYWLEEQPEDYSQFRPSTQLKASELSLVLNHYPLRPVTFSLNREVFALNKANQFILIRSNFRQQKLESLFQIEYVDNRLILRNIN